MPELVTRARLVFHFEDISKDLDFKLVISSSI